ncbi:holo-ACP synthase [Glycomyces dulcitolivorans]|uniref:holo-ACP synthase n=1 Tax=Glycomyces dulcitolivorans TaxID=2200759 RepID=UPI000DD2EB35|nr:holo-ACP synthase [Glycomyces dulcitolivorans]
MIVAVGIDVVAVDRFERVLERTPHVAEKLFTEAERSAPDGRRRRTESLAARFAAKEAVAKALGAPGGMRWADCQVLSLPDGRPSLEITGSVAAVAAQRGVSRWHVSLSHDGGIATAVVIAETA